MGLPARAATSVGFLDDDVDQALNDIDAAQPAPNSYTTQSPGPVSGRRAGGISEAHAGHQGVESTQDGLDSKEAGHVATEEEKDSAAKGAPSSTDTPAAPAIPSAPGAEGGTEGLLPKTASEDDPRAWGDRDDDHDDWLKEQKPPHWG
jgi:hypothetical protein